MEVKNKRVAHNKSSQEEVIKQFVQVHGDDFDYSKVVYVNTNTPVEVYCKKHDFIFTPTPKNHKNGSKCKFCGREAQIEKAKKEQDIFLKEMFALYDDNYDFSKSNYINSKIEVEVVCVKHGVFEKRPCELVKGHGCLECKSQKSKYNNIDIFIEENKKIFGDITDFSLVSKINKNTKVDLICIVHSHNFTLTVSARLNGQKCPKCSMENYRKIRALPIEEYYKKVSVVHNNKYTYTGDYTILKEAITFYCKEYGRQRRNAKNHLNGAGCSKCESIGNRTDKFTKEGYINTANGRVTSLYLIECSNKEEKFYKIGKTFRGVKTRFSGKIIPYDYKIIREYKSTAEEVWDLEESLHIKYKQYSYKPNNWFVGFSECYTMKLPISEIIKLNTK